MCPLERAHALEEADPVEEADVLCLEWLTIQVGQAGRHGRSVAASTSVRANSEAAVLRSRLVLATFVMVTCAACSHNKAASPAPSPSPDPSTSAPSAPTSSISPELAGYNEIQRAAYKTAVNQYDAFTKRNDKFYAVGQTTGAAKKFYQRFAVDWSTAWGNLGQVANNKVTVSGATKTVWTKPRLIEVGGSSKGDVIVLRRCLDESGRVVTQNGKKLDQPQLENPHIYAVRLEKHPGENWWRSGIAEQGQTC
jgi:hypothetical protein